jgi:RNA polymerase sigma-70 factor (ECF subfamily)
LGCEDVQGGATLGEVSPEVGGGVATAASRDVTALLRAWSRGEAEAREKLIPLIYKDLRLRAHQQMGRERRGHTLQTTALLHEAYLRLVGSAPVAWESRNHFFAIAARMMRRILVDHARSKRSLKRGGAGRPVSLDEELLVSERRPHDLISLDEAVQALTALNERKGRVVELRYFGGLSVEETARVLKVSPRTVKGDWQFAKVWLLREMRREARDGARAADS